MREVLLGGLALVAAVFLWLLVKLDQRYEVRKAVWVRLWGGERVPSSLVAAELQIEGSGATLLRRRLPDTLSLARLCKGGYPAERDFFVRWVFWGAKEADLCAQLERLVYHPKLRWILPEGAEFVEPYRWVSDTVWVWKGHLLPSYEQEIVARVGYHTYPVPLPSSWGVYPETLYVQAHIGRYLQAEVEVEPRIVGAGKYQVLLRPARVQVRFLLPESYASDWDPSEFEVVVDMQKVLPEDTAVYPELRRKPPFVRHVELVPRSLEFTRIY